MTVVRCQIASLGFVSKKLNALYCSGPSKAWTKVKNRKAPAATQAIDGHFETEKLQKRIFQRGALDRSLVAVFAAKSQNSDHLFICVETKGM